VVELGAYQQRLPGGDVVLGIAESLVIWQHPADFCHREASARFLNQGAISSSVNVR
jgi:hypothetical protein